MTHDEQLIKAALDMAAAHARAAFDARSTSRKGHHSFSDWTDGYDEATRACADVIRAIDPADVLAKVGAAPAEVVKPPRLMAMCGHCRSAGEEYCVQYLTDLRWDGAEWCCKDCFDGSGENGDWDEATQPCPQPAPDAVARLVKAANQARMAFAGYVPAQTAINKLDEALAAMEASHGQ